MTQRKRFASALLALPLMAALPGRAMAAAPQADASSVAISQGATPQSATPQSSAPRVNLSPAGDSAAIWTLQGENASISTAKMADRNYTNGLRLGYVSPEGYVPGFLQDLGRTLWGAGTQRIGFDLTQQIYTPGDNTSGNPPAYDRPFSAILMATTSLIQESRNTLSRLTVGVGLVGPDAQGERVQNGFHDLIGQRQTNGWHNQLHDEPLLQITSERTWRLPMGKLGALETDSLPALTAGIGNLRDYIAPGVTFRIGQGLDADYGASRMRPGLTGTDVYHNSRPFAWYLFAGFDGQAVLHDLTVEGNTWRTSRGAKLNIWQAEVQAGLGIIYHGVRITYTHVIQTQEYEHQKGGLHQFGSLAASVRF